MSRYEFLEGRLSRREHLASSLLYVTNRGSVIRRKLEARRIRRGQSGGRGIFRLRGWYDRGRSHSTNSPTGECAIVGLENAIHEWRGQGSLPLWLRLQSREWFQQTGLIRIPAIHRQCGG